MKKSFFFILILISCCVQAQTYKLFHASSGKLFTEYPQPIKGYSIKFQSAVLVGSDSVYYNYFNLDNTYYVSSICAFWVPMDFKQNQPSWLGKKVTFNNSDQYTFINKWNTSLNFIFGNNVNDTLLFYSDSLNRFSCFLEKADTISIGGLTDSARFYRIIHKDTSGNILNSPLNQQYIITGRVLGLIRFFRVDSFPLQEQPLTLIGNYSPAFGLTSLTSGFVYDYQAGDEYQYRDAYVAVYPHLSSIYCQYRKYTILSRTDSPDSIHYTVHYTYFSTDTLQPSSSVIQLKYARFRTITRIPFENYAYSDFYNTYGAGCSRSFSLDDFCGMKLWAYTGHTSDLYIFCEQDTCWGGRDTNGPPTYWDIMYVQGIGRYLYIETIAGSSHRVQKQVVYFKKNGIACGQEVVPGIRTTMAPERNFRIFPNPARGLITIESENLNDRFLLTILGDDGRILRDENLSGARNQVDVSSLPAGMYILRFITKTSVTFMRFINTE